MSDSTALVPAPQVMMSRSTFDPQDIDQASRVAGDIAKSTLVPPHLRGKPYDVFATIMYGRELGLSTMQSCLGIWIEPRTGRPGLYEQTALALVMSSPLCEYFQMLESDDEKAIFETKRRNYPKPTKLGFTISQARVAKLLGKDNWANYPAAMLRARAALHLARAVYPDILANVYTPDEIAEMKETIEASAAAEVMRAPPPPAAAAPAPVVPSPAKVSPPPALSSAGTPILNPETGYAPGRTVLENSAEHLEMIKRDRAEREREEKAEAVARDSAAKKAVAAAAGPGAGAANVALGGNPEVRKDPAPVLPPKRTAPCGTCGRSPADHYFHTSRGLEIDATCNLEPVTKAPTPSEPKPNSPEDVGYRATNAAAPPSGQLDLAAPPPPGAGPGGFTDGLLDDEPRPIDKSKAALRFAEAQSEAELERHWAELVGPIIRAQQITPDEKKGIEGEYIKHRRRVRAAAGGAK